MRSLDQSIHSLEKRLKKVRLPDADFCRLHLPGPVIRFSEDAGKAEPPPEKICSICGKPFPPNVPRMAVTIEGNPRHREKR